MNALKILKQCFSTCSPSQTRNTKWANFMFYRKYSIEAQQLHWKYNLTLRTSHDNIKYWIYKKKKLSLIDNCWKNSLAKCLPISRAYWLRSRLTPAMSSLKPRETRLQIFERIHNHNIWQMIKIIQRAVEPNKISGYWNCKRGAH